MKMGEMGMAPKLPGDEGNKLFDRIKEFWCKLSDWLSGEDVSLGNSSKLTSWQEKLDSLMGMLTWKHLAAVVAVSFVLIMGGFYLAFGGGEKKTVPANPEQKIYITVKPGMNADTIAQKLLEHGVIDSKFSFWWQVKTWGLQDKFKTGTYLLYPHMKTEDALAKLISGETTTIKFTIPEGFGIKEIAERLSAEGLVDEQEFLDLAKDYAPYDYVEKKADARYTAEGFLFPDTYEIQSDTTAKDIMKMMARDFDERLTPAMRKRAEKMDLSIYELVTLASLVEKEARFDEDRPIIAQVFFKRLRIGMPLQSDTTLQYLMNAPKEDVSIADTKIDSPYNTYQHYGLPPGPIASPGMAAIEAVLYPADTDYLYFVADRQGHNHYSTSYAQHLAIVDEVR